MRLTLTRRFTANGGVFGTLTVPAVPGGEAWSMEREWRGNARNVSCVPLGDYRLERVDSPKHGETFALIGGTVARFEQPGYRFAILMHPANDPSELEGCLAFGRYCRPDFTLHESRMATQAILALLEEEDENWLTICGPRG